MKYKYEKFISEMVEISKNTNKIIKFSINNKQYLKSVKFLKL